MKWFAQLERKYRIIINVVSFALFFFCISTLGFHYLSILFFVVSIFFCFSFIIVEEKQQRENEYQAQQESERNNRIAELERKIFQQNNQDVFSSTDSRLYNTIDIEFPIYTKVRGVTFEGRQELLRQANDGDELVLIHKPTEKYPEAIVIITKETYDVIGHVSADLATQLIDAFGEGCKFYGEIVEITGGYDGRNYGCNISIEGVEY